MPKQNQITLGILTVIVIVLVAVLGVTYMNGNSGNNSNNSQSTKITVSENAKSFKLGGSHNKGFKEVIFDPFLVKADQKQKIVVSLNSDLSYSEVKATFKDENGEQQKMLEKSTLNDKSVYYSTWKPDKVNSKQYYPIIIEYTIDSGKTNKLSLSWQGK